MTAVTTVSGYLKKDVYDLVGDTLLSLQVPHGFEGKIDRLCCLLAELSCSMTTVRSSSVGGKELPGFLLDKYAVLELLDGNLWTVRRIDELLEAEEYTEEGGGRGNLFELAILLGKLAVDRPLASRRDHIFFSPSVLVPAILLHQSPPSADLFLHAQRDAIVGSLRAALAESDSSAARTVVSLVVARCGARSVTEYNAMHASFFPTEARDYQEPASSGDHWRPASSGDHWRPASSGDYQDPSFWSPLRFVDDDVVPPLGGNKKRGGAPRRRDIVWGIWRTIAAAAVSDSVHEFVTRLASLYSYRWTPATRHVRVNFLLYAITVCVRGKARCEEPGEDVAALIEVVRARSCDLCRDILRGAKKNENIQ